MNNLEQLESRKAQLLAQLAAYPTGGRPSYVSSDIAYDQRILAKVNAQIDAIEATL